jgi:hypothetical protein
LRGRVAVAASTSSSLLPSNPLLPLLASASLLLPLLASSSSSSLPLSPSPLEPSLSGAAASASAMP